MASLDPKLKEYMQALVHHPIDSWDELEQVTTIKTFSKGDHFFQHYDRCDEVAIVGTGLFRIYLIDHEGEEKTFSFIQEKGFILDFFLTWKRSTFMVSCQALEDSQIYSVKYKDFIHLMRTKPIWNEVYREILTRNYMSKTRREIEFVRFNAKERLKLSMQSKHLDISRIPKTYLASYLGIAPPSLSRLLREIKETSESEPKEVEI